MIKAIFYSKFDTQEGPKVVHQVPDGAITPSSTALPNTSPLFNFPDISFFVIPRQELCGNLLHVCSNGYRIMGNPICIQSPRYDRNEFIFNFCVVLAEDEEWASHKSVVQKLANLMCELEEQSGFLSKDVSKRGQGKVHSLCETLMEDLNNYCECMIPIDELNTLNIKLFPQYPPPPAIKAWHVPLFTVRYEAFMDENWDLTLQRVVPYINGVNSVQIISVLADTDFSLTCRAIQHLVYYGCIFLLDIFSFSAIYAPTAQFASTIATDEEMQRECACYVNTRFSSLPANFGLVTTSPARSRAGSISSSTQKLIPSEVGSSDAPSFLDDRIWPAMGDNSSTAADDSSTIATTSTSDGRNDNDNNEFVDGVGLVELYARLRQGQSVKQWYLDHMRELANIDVRRFLTFGVIKGFLYRVHKYAYATGYPAQHPTARIMKTAPHMVSRSRVGSTATSGADVYSDGSLRRLSGAYSVRRLYHEGGDDEDGGEGDEDDEEDDGDADAVVEDDDNEEDEDAVDDKTLEKYLDGNHCFDQICTELQMSDKELTTRLKRYPEQVLIIHR